MVEKYKYDFNIPQDVKDLLDKLHTKYEAYIVGGCVRDLLLKKTPKDYDITTNATPEQIKELFKDHELINNNGEKHGTVTVRYNGENYEITTYRLDGEYSDHRHPDEVTFTNDLQEDLSRRDFTINALVYDGEYVLDYFGGVEDLEHKVIRAVGEPGKRFSEDALRILRMIRFASVLDFDIEMDTLLAANELKSELFYIAKERKTVECNKLVCGNGFARLLLNVLVYNILEQVLPLEEVSYHRSVGDLYRIFSSPFLNDRGYVLSYAIIFRNLSARKLLFYDLALSNEDKDKISDICTTVQEKLRRLTQGNTFINCNSYQEAAIRLFEKALRDLKHNDNQDYCKTIMVNSILYAYGLGYIDMYKLSMLRRCLEEVFANGCYSLRQLAINGNDLIELGLKPGPVIKDLLEGYLNDVIEGKVENTRRDLLAKVKSEVIDKLN